MVSVRTHKQLTWIDVQNPTREEVLHIAEQYPLPAVFAEELLTKTIRSKVDYYDKLGLIYLVLHFPAIDPKTKLSFDQEIDVIIGKNYIITTHYESLQGIHDFAKIFEVRALVDRGHVDEHAGHLFVMLLRELYAHCEESLTSINRELVTLEEHIYAGEKNAIEEISSINRRLLTFQQALRFHASVIKSFELSALKIFGPDFEYQLPSITNDYTKIETILHGHQEILRDLRETNDSIISTKTNNVIRFLTVMTFSIVPLSIFPTVLSIPGVVELLNINSIGDHLTALGILTLISLCISLYFKKIHWL